MSGYISSFIIDPVVRQARRFSSRGSSASRPPISGGPRSQELQSHANPGPIALRDAHATHTNSPAVAIFENAIADGDFGASGCSNADVLDDTASLPPLLLDVPNSVPVTQLDSAAEVAFKDSILEDEAVDNILDSPSESPFGHDNNVLIIAAQRPPITPPFVPPDIVLDIATPEDVEMAPSSRPSMSGRGDRTSSARDIPRPQMSLREDSPSRAVASLPADDGMKLLRERIQQIHGLNAPQVEKARRMHELMTADWQASQMALRPQSPASTTSQERTLMPSSPLSTSTAPRSPESVASIFAPPFDPSNPFNIHPEDLQPSYRPLPDPNDIQDSEDSRLGDSRSNPNPTCDAPEPVLGCKHYKRNVKIQCFDCKEWHSCRHCHDTAVTTHKLNRKATENMLCMLCWTPQAASQYCKACGETAAWYFCDICKLWDDDAAKSIYHCNDCGICRRGEGLGKDYIHCKKCNVCISIAHYATHTCLENATDSNCPLCLDYMFTSPLEIVAMPCGHYLHHHCYTSLMLSTYQCPICKRSAVNMETQWRKLEEEIRHQPMPHEWRDVKVEVKCNDCAAVTISAFHWLGVKCGRCDGFNTGTVRMLAENEDQRRDVQDFAEARRERRAEHGREIFRRTVTAPVTVRPYFNEDDDHEPSARPRSARPENNGFQLPDFPRIPYPNMPNLPNMNLAEYYMGRIPNMPNMPNMPSMPGFAFPFDLGVLDRVGRSLSPIRHYFDDQIVEGVPRQFRRMSEGVAGNGSGNGNGVRRSVGDENREWEGEEAWLEESSEDEEFDDEDEDEDSEEEGDDEEDEDSDEMMDIGSPMDEDEEDVGGLSIELTGHR